MKLHVSADDVELTPEIEEIVNKKLIEKIEKFFVRYPEDTVTLKLFIKKGARWGFVVKCDLDIPGENIHSEEKHKELEYAVVALSHELVRRLRKKKEKALN